MRQRRTRLPSVIWALAATALLVSYFAREGHLSMLSVDGQGAASLELARIPGIAPRNVILVLTDDHRYDAMSFMGHPYLQTPNLDQLARGGVHFQNAFVTTSLCSPSRASILTGLYAHRHRVVDNNNVLPADTLTFPQYLQRAGYETALIGKWHMGGEIDEPQRGFDHWVSFKGQGTYVPNPNGLNVNGKRVPQKGYITDELTEYAVDWLEERQGQRPFMLYLSHKALHVDVAPDSRGRGTALLPGTEGRLEFVAAPRHKGKYRDRTVPVPKTMADTPANYEGKPMWVKNQRNSRLGVDFGDYTQWDLQENSRQYAETLLAVDESLGRILEVLRRRNWFDSTLIIYMGDNGSFFGEHGLIDKRAAYEGSVRIPLLVHCPEWFKGGTRVTQLAANIDVAPTVLEAAGLRVPAGLDGGSLIRLARSETIPWRRFLLYEYFWERNFPMIPSMHAIRGEQYKFIRYHGIWDTDEMYDLQADPQETQNLIRDPKHQPMAETLRQELFKTLASTDGLFIPLQPDRGKQLNHRWVKGAKPAQFPSYLMRE
ncbi:MAG: sulfatase [Acidobacteria bacterium]|nr:sulfatase [Acidobacteriota bacterium]